MPGDITGLPCSWGKGGNKYRNLAFQVRGVSKVETMKYAHESRGTHLRKAALAMLSKN
jgi:hypothetical protein